MNVAVGAKSDIGRVREVNEDSFLVDEPLFVVADGMGGHLAGDVASTTAVDTIRSRSGDASPEDLSTLTELVRSANSRIWEKAQHDPTLRGMGTTCTLLMVDGSAAHIAHVGDSRAYLFRNGKLSQLTEDHSLVGRMVKEGRLSAEEAERHPQRSIITRALGVDSDVEVDLLTVEVAEGDRLMICSDGLTSMVEPSEITEALAGESDPQAAADRLVQIANEAGGEDNITVVLIDIGGGSGAKRTATATGRRADTAGSPPRPVAAPSSAEMTGTRPAPILTAEREDLPLAEEPPPGDEEDEEPYRPRRRWPRRLIGALLLIGVFVAGTIIGVNYLVENSWYVGVNDDGRLTIYNGIPEEVPGLTLREVQEVTDLSISKLPDFLRENVRDGIKVDSLDEARTRVRDLEERAVPDEPRDRRRPDRKKQN